MKISFFEARRGFAVHAATVMLFLLTSDLAAAHSFTIAIVGPADDGGAVLQAAIDGFRLATRERDGHPNEESDGHLGGLDVYIVPLSVDTPQAAADLCAEVGLEPELVLVTATTAFFEIVAEAVCDSAIVFRPGRLPPDEVWSGGSAASGSTDFASRFRAEYGRPPNRAAAEGYNAARRIDAAVRSLGALSDRRALATALSETESGLTW